MVRGFELTSAELRSSSPLPLLDHQRQENAPHRTATLLLVFFPSNNFGRTGRKYSSPKCAVHGTARMSSDLYDILRFYDPSRRLLGSVGRDVQPRRCRALNCNPKIFTTPHRKPSMACGRHVWTFTLMTLNAVVGQASSLEFSSLRPDVPWCCTHKHSLATVMHNECADSIGEVAGRRYRTLVHSAARDQG